MKKNSFGKRILTAISAIGMIFMALPGIPSSASAIPVTITFSANRQPEVMETYIRAFEQENPGIQVEYVYLGNYEADMQTAVEDGTLSDVFFVPSFMGTDDFDKNLLNLGSYSSYDEKYLYMRNSYTKDGTVYGIPSAAYVSGLIYNKEVFSEAGITSLPTTPEEFLEDLELIKERTDAIPFYSNYSTDWALGNWETFPFIEMTGNPEYQYNDFLYIRNPFSEGSTHYTVYNLLYRIVSGGLSEERTSTIDWGASQEMLNNGEIGCEVAGSWALEQFVNAGDHGDNVGFMPFPNSISGMQYMTISTDYCYGVYAGTEHPEEAKKFLNFMLDESGYALDHQTFSLVRSDPFPDVYGDMSDVSLLLPAAAKDNNWNFYSTLTSALNLTDGTEIRRVMDVGFGAAGETFDDVMADWNQRWEDARPEDMGEMSQGTTNVSSLLDGLRFEEYEVNLSAGEQDFINQAETFTVGYQRDLAPFQYEKDGEFAGVSRQIFDLISSETGLQFTFVPYDNRDALLSAVGNGEVDLLAGVETDYADEQLRVSKSYLDYVLAIVKAEGTPLDQISSKRVATLKGGNITLHIDEETGDNAVPFDTTADMLKGVSGGNAEYLATGYYIANFYINDLELSHLNVIPSSLSMSMAIGFSNQMDSALIAICNKCVYGISDTVLQRILTEEMEPEAKPVNLRRLVRENPWQAMGILALIFILIFVGIYRSMQLKIRSERMHAMDVKRYEILEALTDEYVFEVDYDQRTFSFDAKFEPRFGIPRTVSLDTLEDKNDCLNAIIEYSKQGQGKDAFVSEPFSVLQDGEAQYYRLELYTIADDKGNNPHAIGKIVNVDAEVQKELEERDRANHDPLTGIYNRAGFAQAMEELDASAGYCFFISDLDNFKSINDHLGHVGGDKALVLYARELERIFAGKAIIGRFGGDEFVGYIHDCDREEVELLLQRTVSHMHLNVEHEGKEQKISISLGAIYSKHKDTVEKLLPIADEQLYKAKAAGKDRYMLAQI